MPQSQRENSNKNNKERPSASELIGASKQQLKRQGKERIKNTQRNDSTRNEESGGWFYQTFLGTASIAFVVLGIIALGIWGVQKINEAGESAFTPAEPPQLISVPNAAKITLSSTTPATEISATTAPENGFSQSYGVYREEGGERKLSAEELLDELGSGLEITPYIQDEFMYGQYANGPQQGRYLLFSVTDYSGAYGQLLANEATIGSIFSPLGFTDATNFSDAIIENQDVRFAENSEGAIYYSFPRQNRLVITTNRETLVAIFRKISQQ